MSTQTLLTALFQYKAAVDDELLEALAGVNGQESAPPLHTAIRVLNHAHVVDRIFAAHLQNTGHDYEKSWTDDTPTLDKLSSAVRETDRWYLDYVAGIRPDVLAEAIGFTFTDGSRGCMSREEMLAHMVTHGGYHRGEIGRLLPQIGDTTSRDVFAGYLHRAEPGRRA